MMMMMLMLGSPKVGLKMKRILILYDFLVSSILTCWDLGDELCLIVDYATCGPVLIGRCSAGRKTCKMPQVVTFIPCQWACLDFQWKRVATQKKYAGAWCITIRTLSFLFALYLTDDWLTRVSMNSRKHHLPLSQKILCSVPKLWSLPAVLSKS